MFRERIRRLEQISQLEQNIAAMPAYPIYRESDSCYSIYVQGSRQVFSSEAEVLPLVPNTAG